MKHYCDYLKNTIAISIILGLSVPTTAFAVAGKFQFVNGEVQVLDASGKARAVKKGDAIDQGETVASGANGFAQIRMEDGGFFAIRPETEFKIDTFKYEGKEDGSEKGIFSLIKGSLRSVTGVVGKKHRDNYKINTATATIGIRGSGADAGTGPNGTAVRTLFGGHTLTSGGKTIVTGPGQTAFAPPGAPPQFVPNFPFNTSTTGGGNNNGGNESGDNSSQNNVNNNANNSQNNNPGNTGSNDKVVIPIVDTEGNNYTENKTADGGGFDNAFAYTGKGKLPSGSYVHFISAIRSAFSGSGFVVAEQGQDGLATYAPGNYTFGSNGALIGVDASELRVFDAGGDFIYGEPSSLAVQSGTLEEFYMAPDKSIFIGRASNVAVNTACSVCSGTDNFVSVHSLVGLITSPLVVQAMTGTANYSLIGNTRPTDAFGHVGTLNNAYLNADFTSQTVDFGVNISIDNKNLVASASSIPITLDGFDAETGSGLTVNCYGACASTANGEIGGTFFGNAAGTAALGYSFWPDGNTSGNFYDYVHGLAVFGNAGTSVAGVVGGGGAAVGSFSSSPGQDFNEFNIVDNVNFSSRHDLNGNVIAWTNTSNSTAFFASGTVVRDGADPTLGVVWGRWSAFSATSTMLGSLPNQGGLSFITGTHITTAMELMSPGSFTGSGLTNVAGDIIGTYNLMPGSFPAGINGSPSTVFINSASAEVNLSTLHFNTFTVSGGGGGPGGFAGAWTVALDGMAPHDVSDFNNGGLTLTGSGLNGKAVGSFVGNQAQGLISTVGLTDGSNKLGAAVYMKR